MRTGGYTTHQTLTTEAATFVNQALTLARRRGHAQVTPLHVASTMLSSSSTGLLRTACLQSHSHPLQLKALELCFNVALNRLPISSSSTPRSFTLSNALVAAFKRAQAHQRRGSIENQQQPILALKVELEQLVVSILDDPSVSRVMREAGFSSTQVKANVEQAMSLEVCSQSPSPPPVSCCQSKEIITKPNDQVSTNSEEDVKSVLDSLVRKKRRNIVVVGECLASAERVVKGVIEKFDRGDVHGDMKYVQFISLPLSSLKNLPVGEAEKRFGELRCLVKSCVGRGVVLYVGDLKWASEFWSSYGGHSRNYCCPVELMVMELSRLLGGIGESGKLWLMGIATLQTYMSCKTGQPSLETLWQLHPLTIPVGSLGLSLTLESDMQGHEFQSKVSRNECSWSQIRIGVEKNLNCCKDCLANFNREAGSIGSNSFCNESTTTSSSSCLPSWLQQYKEENLRKTTNDQEFNKLKDLCKKWNSICSSIHKKPHFFENALNFSSSSISTSSYDRHNPNLHHTLSNWPVIFEPKPSPKEHQFFTPENGIESFEFGSSLRRYIPERNERKPDLLSNPNSSPNSASSSEAEEDIVECLDRFKELNSENLKVLCNALEKKVPWQKDIIPDIASTILQCRSGTITRKCKLKCREDKEETWLFFLGVDFKAKEKIAKELAKLVFGSQTNFVTIGLSNFSSTRGDSSEEFSNKRGRDESGSTYLERFAEAVQENASRVFFMEDVEQVDYCSQKGIKRAIESGRIALPGGELAPLKDAIVIFSCESFSSMSRACSPPIRPNSSEQSKNKNDPEEDDELEERRPPCASLDLNSATEDEEYSVADILDYVDRQIIFKIQVL
ncbi:unnamed protein product [Camellia sinensis]